MKGSLSSAALLLALASLAISIASMKRRGDAVATAPAPPAGRKLHASLEKDSEDRLDARVSALEEKFGLERRSGDDFPAGSDATATGGAPISDRLDGIETALAKLTQDFEGISLEAASEEREALFRTESGYLKADEYFAAGKYAIAGEGYLAFLDSNPEHPEAYDILKRARQAFSRAGYNDKAVWAQQELVRNLGEDRRAEDVLTLAQMEKEAGSYDDAIRHAAEAAELSPEIGNRLWNRMYWAWYNQLRDGDSAGLEAYREVQREIEAAGQGGEKVGERVQEKIEEIERAQAARPATASD